MAKGMGNFGGKKAAPFGARKVSNTPVGPKAGARVSGAARSASKGAAVTKSLGAHNKGGGRVAIPGGSTVPQGKPPRNGAPGVRKVSSGAAASKSSRQSLGTRAPVASKGKQGPLGITPTSTY